jgi:hypothetical protein
MKTPHRLLLLFAACAVSAGAARAQQPADAPSANRSQDTPAPTARDNANTSDKKAKKVWTEDDVHKLEGAVSVVGDAKSASKRRSSGNTGSKSSAALYYKEQLTKLEGQLDDTDKKLTELQNFNGDNSSDSAIHMNQGLKRTSIQDQIKQLEDKKKQINAQMQNIFDQARRSGIEPGALR